MMPLLALSMELTLDAQSIARSGTMHFVVTGEFMTHQARQFLQEGDEARAVTFLMDTTGMSREVADQILQGTKCLVGDSGDEGVWLADQPDDAGLAQHRGQLEWLWGHAAQIKDATGRAGWYRAESKYMLDGVNGRALALMSALNPNKYDYVPPGLRHGTRGTSRMPVWSDWVRRQEGHDVVTEVRHGKGRGGDSDYALVAWTPCMNPPLWMLRDGIPRRDDVALRAVMDDEIPAVELDGYWVDKIEYDFAVEKAIRDQMTVKTPAQVQEALDRELARQTARERHYADDVIRIRQAVAEQAERVGGWIDMVLPTRTVKVAKAPFDAWCFDAWMSVSAFELTQQHPEMFGVTDQEKLALGIQEWVPVSEIGWKQIGDNPYHTDWVVSAGLQDQYKEPEIYAAAMKLRMARQNELYRLRNPERQDVNMVVLVPGPGKVVGAVVKPGPDQSVPPGSIAVVPNATIQYDAAMRSAAAVVVEIGGMMSHLAVNAVPVGTMIVRIEDCMERFNTGDIVSIDVGRGTWKVVG